MRHRRASAIVRLLSPVLALAASAVPALASPWAELGDQLLRSDLEILAHNGLISGLVTTWPIPWGQISTELPREVERDLPGHVERSLQRVRRRLRAETAVGQFGADAVVRTTNEPALVRDFATTARAELDARARLEYMGKTSALRLAVGAFSEIDLSDEEISFDDSYIAKAFGNWIVYGGLIEQWWGPGWISSLILSNNARPVPHIGVMRNVPEPFETRWLSWLGPWRLNAFLGLLSDDDRRIEDTLLLGFRATINPLPGLELGAHRATQFCGNGQECDLNSWQSTVFLPDDDAGANTTNVTNGISGLDFRYAARLAGQDFSTYGQFIAEDLGNFFFSHTSGLLGLSLWGPAYDDGALWRVTAEFSDTRARNNHGFSGTNLTYNHAIYGSGYRFRDRALGHSLDGDSQLVSLVAQLTDLRSWTYRLAYHFGEINRDGTSQQTGPPLSRNREEFNLIEAGLAVPWRSGGFNVELRFRDDSPNTPGESSAEFGVEAGVHLRF